MDTLFIILLAVGTLMLAVISRRSLLHLHSHGFYRFFAWEGILLLVCFNAPFWVDDPLSTRQIISWILLTTSIYPVAHGTFLLRFVGKPIEAPRTGSDLAFEQTTNLVTTGVYKYIRHPLYASLLYLAWGVYLKEITWLTSGIVVAVSLFLFATAKAEEKENIVRFGEHYMIYATQTKMFIPYVW